MRTWSKISAVSSIASVNTPVFWANFTTTIWDWTSNTHTVITIPYCIYTAVQKYYTVKRIHAQNTQKGKNATIPKPLAAVSQPHLDLYHTAQFAQAYTSFSSTQE